MSPQRNFRSDAVPDADGKGSAKGRGVEAGHFGRDGKISLCMKGEDTHTQREKAVLG